MGRPVLLPCPPESQPVGALTATTADRCLQPWGLLLLLLPQACIRVWGLHGPNARNFEDRFPGFAAWREQHKGVPADVTLGCTLSGGRVRKRNRKRKAADKE
jgi:hypothetical protein